MPNSEQEAFRRLAVELQILEGTANTLQARLNMVNAALAELSVSRMTLEGVENENPDAPLFVPIGGGSFIKAKLESNDKIIVGAGAGVSIERSMADAKQTVQNRISELEKTRTSIQQQLTQILERIQQGRDQFQELSARLTQAERRSSVSEAERKP